MAKQGVLTVNESGKNNVDSLLSEKKWSTNAISYSFPTNASTWSGYSSGSEPYSNFVPLSDSQQAAAREALASWASVCNLSFYEVSEPSQSGVIRIGTSSDPSTSWAYYPSTSELGGDVWFGNSNRNSPSEPVKGTYAYLTYIHELGHALGLKHPHDTGGTGVVAATDIDSMEYSVMSYCSYAGASVNGGYSNGSDSYAYGPMLNDIAAIQYMYGANYNYNSGDTVYTFDPSKSKIFETIWDGGGTDTYDFSLYTTDLAVNLEPGSWNTCSSSQLAYLGYSNGSIYASGNIANAFLYNNDTRSLIENTAGGSGNDIITGNQANNVLVGNNGNDSLTGLTGNDVLDGGNGVDTAVFSDDLSNYSIISLNGKTMISNNSGSEGFDTLYNIENLQFGNTTVSSSYQQFNALNYIASYNDLIAAFGTDTNTATSHFENYGFTEQRNVTFDGLDYIASNSDLIKAFGADSTAGASHYIQYGHNENRTTNSFSATQYLAKYSDLQNAFGTDVVAATLHYIQYGYNEGRTY